MHKYPKLETSSFYRTITSWFSSQNLAIALVIFGIAVRVVQYLSNRSLWADEATLALNIVHRSFLELFQPLDYDQGAPIGFLLGEKLAVQVFGDTEYALRLFPLLSGVAAIFLFYQLAQQWLQHSGQQVALLLFVCLNPLIYYSSEVKQYSSDVAIALLLGLFIPRFQVRLTHQQAFIRASIGAIVVWFSHPAVFVLAGLEASNLLNEWLTHKKIKILEKIPTYAAWLVSFGLVYFVSLRNLGSDEELLQSWRKAFPSHWFDVAWGLDALGKFFSNPLGFSQNYTDAIAILAFLVGSVSLFRRHRKVLWFALAPIAVTLAASYLQKYPFRSRLLIFLIPFFLLLIAEGIHFVCTRKSKVARLLSISLSAILLFTPIAKASTLLAQPQLKEEIKPVMGYIQAQRQPGDLVYVYQRGIYQFQYYAKKLGFAEGSYVLGVDDLDTDNNVRTLSEIEKQRYKADLDKLRGRQRVWLLFAHANVGVENAFIESYLNQVGKRSDTFVSPGAYVYLYDLR
ncbi:MAG TPA: hypothetical protein V6D18_12480 [Thermosynechococcaceae cyanobacterium]